MTNIQSVTIAMDGQYKRLNIMYDTIDESGKTIATNQRLSRIISDDSEAILSNIDAVINAAMEIVKEEE